MVTVGATAALAADAVVSVPALAVARAGAPRAVGLVVVSSLADSGPGTLRAAITAVNSGTVSSPAEVDFTVAGVITLASALPAIGKQVTVDGTTAPGYAAGGPPVVEVNCHGNPGLQLGFGSDGAQLLGLSVVGASGTGVMLTGDDLTVNDDYIGLTLTGAADGNTGNGVYVSSTSSGDRIGINTSGDSGAVANVISANHGAGIVLAGSSDDVVQANRIGTSPAGTTAVPNLGSGIWITGGAHGNQIGGTDFTDAATGKANNPTGSKGTVTPVFVVPPDGNLVSGNARTGILIDGGAHGNVLNGNFVGTTANGDSGLGNGRDGVWIDGANGNSLVGCRFVNNPFVYYNVVSGNGGNGLRITDADGSVVQGNFFGIGANNTTVVANHGDGVLVQGTSANTQVGGVIPLGNVASGNRRDGIEVTGRARGFITFNTFGGLLAFKGAAPNGRDGLLITSSGTGNQARTNVFSGNRRNGIEIGGYAHGDRVDPDIAGLTTKGNAALPNGGDGVIIDGHAHNNLIGGTLRSVIPQNTFAGNHGYGLAITGHAHDNRVVDSFIGTKIGGLNALPNGRGGVLVGGDAYRNYVGRAGRRPVNLISGNAGNGVTLGTGSRGNWVLANFIGLNRAAHLLPNTRRQVVNRGKRNKIRGNRIG